MRIPEDDNFKCPKESIDYSELDEKIIREIEAQAEAEKQKQILNGKIEQLKNKKLAELTALETQRELYGLDDKKEIKVVVEKQNEVANKCNCNIGEVYKEEKNNLKHKISKSKEKLMMCLALVIMLVLAIGVSPQGAWFDFIQQSWVELIVDVFRIGMLGFGGYLVYKLFKDREQ